MNQEKNNINDNYKNAETRIYKLTNSNKIVINNILHFLTLEIIIFIDDYKEYRYYNVQYNNVTFIISQQITINHLITLYIYKT